MVDHGRDAELAPSAQGCCLLMTSRGVVKVLRDVVVDSGEHGDDTASFVAVSGDKIGALSEASNGGELCSGTVAVA